MRIICFHAKAISFDAELAAEYCAAQQAWQELGISGIDGFFKITGHSAGAVSIKIY